MVPVEWEVERKRRNFFFDGIKKQTVSTVLNPQELTKLLTSIDQEMLAKGAYGETTGVVIVLSESGIIETSVGDSGAMVFSKSGTQNLTASHVRKPFLGSGQAIPISFTCSRLDGTLLVASDGLLKYTSQEKITATIATTDFGDTARKLVDLVRYQSGALPDDISILLARSE